MSRRDRGAVLVELALVTPVLLILVMGIIDYGVLFSDKIALRGGVREATWNGSRSIFGSAQPCPLTGVGATGNAAADANARRLMCMVKWRSDLPASEIRVKVSLVAVNPAASPPAAFRRGGALMVCAMRSARSTTGFYGFVLDGTVQRARLTSVVVNDAAPGGVSALEETPFAGQSWAFCDQTRPAPR